MQRLFLCIYLFPLLSSASPSPIPSQTKALLLAIPAEWGSTDTELQLYRRKKNEESWTPFESPKSVHLGRHGLAWGRGLHAAQEGIQKREGDRKSPSGAFLLGSILYGYADRLSFPGWRYHCVTERDLWIEDPSSLNYNRHLILSPKEAFPANHLYDQMRQEDPAHALKLFIRHNAPPDTQRGAGSAVFFHLTRGSNSTTTGCTSMKEEDFTSLLNAFSPADQPVYVLLPRSEYDRLRKEWKLP
jgi:L,D-peptidoglycan transpeptidase YkuD (ErfK/YbiS/YcfS/YnhG family)